MGFRVTDRSRGSGRGSRWREKRRCWRAAKTRVFFPAQRRSGDSLAQRMAIIALHCPPVLARKIVELHETTLVDDWLTVTRC